MPAQAGIQKPCPVALDSRFRGNDAATAYECVSIPPVGANLVFALLLVAFVYWAIIRIAPTGVRSEDARN